MDQRKYQETIKTVNRISAIEAAGLIEDVLDVLIEVGNGTTEEMLRDAANDLFVVRDKYLHHMIAQEENEK